MTGITASTCHASKYNSLSKLPQFPVTAPDWLCTSAEVNPPTLCSDPVMSSQAQQQVEDLARQVKNANDLTSTFYTIQSIK